MHFIIQVTEQQKNMLLDATEMLLKSVHRKQAANAMPQFEHIYKEILNEIQNLRIIINQAAAGPAGRPTKAEK